MRAVTKIPHDKTRAIRSYEFSQAKRDDINIVLAPCHHWPCVDQLVHRQADLVNLLKPLPPFDNSVVAGPGRGHAHQAAATLVKPLHNHPSAPLLLIRHIEETIASIISKYCTTFHYHTTEATLSCVKNTTCPKFHSDNVEMRLLFTFVGKGTVLVENWNIDRYRLNKLPRGDKCGFSAIKDHGCIFSSLPGEAVLLKGHQWAGAQGQAAIHRSPDGVNDSNPRLLLKLDPGRSKSLHYGERVLDRICQDKCCSL